jgi:hypothetical protein
MTVARSLMNRMILLLLGSTILISCGDSAKPTKQKPDGTSIAVPLSKTAADEIASAEVVVTGPYPQHEVFGRESTGLILEEVDRAGQIATVSVVPPLALSKSHWRPRHVVMDRRPNEVY